MKNNLTDLTNYLFEQIENINGCDQTEEELQRNIKKAEAINQVAENIIKNSELQLKTAVCMQKMGANVNIPKTLLLTQNDDEEY